MFQGDSGDEESPGETALQVPAASIQNDDVNDFLQIGVDGAAYVEQSDRHVETIGLHILVELVVFEMFLEGFEQDGEQLVFVLSVLELEAHLEQRHESVLV